QVLVVPTLFCVANCCCGGRKGKKEAAMSANSIPLYVARAAFDETKVTQMARIDDEELLWRAEGDAAAMRYIPPADRRRVLEEAIGNADVVFGLYKKNGILCRHLIKGRDWVSVMEAEGEAKELYVRAVLCSCAGEAIAMTWVFGDDAAAFAAKAY